MGMERPSRPVGDKPMSQGFRIKSLDFLFGSFFDDKTQVGAGFRLEQKVGRSIVPVAARVSVVIEDSG